jgi:signal transduction histidine kinase/ligand-binding sensor domain-containing protein
MRKKRRTIQLAWLTLCLLARSLAAADNVAGPADSPFIVDSWSVDNEPGKGPPDNEVISVVQTHDGYLWLGTLHGLMRFDGLHFTLFDVMNTPGLPSNRIVYLFEDRKTNLWVGTESSGLCCIHNGVVKNFDLHGMTAKIIYAEEDEVGTVWFCTDDGKIFNVHAGEIDLNPSKISSQLYNHAYHVSVSAANGGAWRSQDGQIQKLHGGRVEKNWGACPWPTRLVLALFRSGSSSFPVQFDLNVTAACCDHDGNLIVGTRASGVYWCGADGTFQHIATKQGLSSDDVLSLCLDRAGDVWVGTDGNGLNRIKRKLFDTPLKLHAWDAQSLAADSQGGLWAAFNARGISYWTTNTIQDFAIGSLSNAWCVLVDDKQRVWSGTRDDGLFLFGDNHFVNAPGAEILGKAIFALFESRDEHLWAGTQNGLADFNGQDWRLFTRRDGLSENSVRAIAEDKAGNLWIGTESGGLNYFKGGKFTVYHATANGLPGDDISCLYAGRDDVLWVGTGGHGLARFDNGKWTRFSTKDGLASDSISYIASDREGYLWVGSNEGLMRIQKKSLDDFAAGVTNIVSCRTYSKADGLPTRECSAGSQPATCRTADDRLWFPTIKGVALVNPAQITPNLQPPQVMIESILVDGREQKTNSLDSAWPFLIVVPPGSEELEIHYTALNFSAPESVRFKCWLQNHESSPKDFGEERIARYPKLPPGHYVFRVEACNEDNVWSGPDAAILSVTVQPYFWQTWPFRAPVILLILAVVAAIVRYVSTQKLHRQLQSLRQREALERERARIARDLHDQLGANLTQIALLGEMAEADKAAPEEIESHAQQISQTARETTRALDEIVWAVNPANDTLDGLVNYAGKYAQEYFALAGLGCRADLPTQLPALPIPPEVRHNVFLAFKEAVHNIVKHAQATEAWIRLRLEPKHFILEIEDNGRGMESQTAAQNRNGLRNMKKRMEDIRGEFSIGAVPERGTIVRLTVPINLKKQNEK